ncbi:winged helix-turn-helix domain-containing protein [Methylomonas sp. SURF-1]|uniref:Winged helix-turn-helix domain-containing protein n=1 Tax=Methylomonas aurea TaxID=2952224 RepID=A0ABT1UBS7_9GAMM|nr:winged helix-turn-helix domain-containing protein [Methylomonas sp. SURF-1]MCQ8179669.1 winged helix-turn-helix domain-containing protein [Methylomonas sp. SURF-1]
MNPTKTDADSLLPQLKITLRLLHNQEIAMGPGKAELLAAIQKTGSIMAAGKTMNMSYRRAWLLVDVMNRSFAEPLVHAAKGGRHGGGTVLTPMGERVLEQYLKMVDAVNHSANAYLPLFSGLMAAKQDAVSHQTEISEQRSAG